MVGERTDKPLPTDRQTVELEKAVLETFVGAYEIAGMEARVTFEEDSLHIQIPGQPKLKLHAESETNFFIIEAPVSLEFQKDESGQVTGVIIDQGGQKMEAKKKKITGIRGYDGKRPAEYICRPRVFYGRKVGYLAVVEFFYLPASLSGAGVFPVLLRGAGCTSG